MRTINTGLLTDKEGIGYRIRRSQQYSDGGWVGIFRRHLEEPDPSLSGAKNFYMTPFVCHVTGANADASLVDVGYAIPSRRCLNASNCFRPPQPAYWLGADDPRINLPEITLQLPNYSILNGFRGGA